MSGAAKRAVRPYDNSLSSDLVRESRAARVRQLMAEGLTLSQIAERLGISEAEVREWMDAARIIP